ncbi:MAG: FAD:protein FMN transferase [Synergistaceae bacterium]|nr:FAD:protein FMN transferase [Synergistaceae bacterium]
MRRKIFIASLLILAGLLSWYLAPIPEHEKNGFAMNTIIRIMIRSRDDNALNDAYNLLARLDKALSMYNKESEISRINSFAGSEKFSASPEVIEAVKDSRRVYDLTDGIFNPLIGAVTRLWKINEADKILPSQESLDAAIKLSAINNLEIGEDYIYLRENGCVIDLGGIAKGYASKKIADFLKSRGVESGIIDLGGNIYAIGLKENNESWNIGIRDPLEPSGSPAVVLAVSDTSVITSGNYERYKIVDGKRFSHFFDPKTGESIQSDLLSVTIISPDGSLADGLATAFMIAGSERAIKLSQKISSMPGIILIRQNSNGAPEILASSNLKDSIKRTKYPVKMF